MRNFLDNLLYKRVTEGHDSFLADPAARKSSGEKTVGYGFAAEGAENSVMVQTAAEDLRKTLQIALHAPEKGEIQKIILKIKPRGGSRRDFILKIQKDSVTLAAESEWGLASGLFALQRKLKNRRGPFLKQSVTEVKNHLDPLIINPNFKNNYTISLHDPSVYSKEEMLAAARAGYTAWNLIVYADDFGISASYPELSAAQSSAEAIRKISDQARQCSLEIYLTVYMKTLPGNHPVFQRVKDMKGSRHFLLADSYFLCASSPDTRRYYQEIFGNIAAESGIRGIILPVGCEGLQHCFTCPATNAKNKITCPACSLHDPETVVASLVNCIAESVKKTSPDIDCVIWTYGLHAWCKDSGEHFISLLSRNCILMANFDTGDVIWRGGAKGAAFDYSLSNIGPSKVFLAQRGAALKKGLRCWTKCENSVALEYCSISSIPALTRWMKKFIQIRKSGISGALLGWDFCGYRGELSSELAGCIACSDPEETLSELAVRDFGKNNRNIIFRIWKQMDQILANHPFSIESAGYFRGPFFLGSGHPLLFFRNDWTELANAYGKNGSMLVQDLSWTIPYGVKAFRKALRKMNVCGKKAMDLLHKLNPCAEDPYRRKCIQRHLALCEVFLRMIQSSENLLEFYIARDSLFAAPLAPEQSEKKIRNMIAIAEREMENTVLALKALHKDPLIGHSCNYPDGISEKRYRLKIRHLDKLIHADLPLFHYRECFNREMHPCWIHAETEAACKN